METKDTHSESEEIEVDEQFFDTLNDSFYIVSSRDEIPFYAAGILDVSETEYDKGIDF